MDISKENLQKQTDKYLEIREDFFAFLDSQIPKLKNTDIFNFSNSPKLDAKEIYEHFYKLDYQARKLRGFIVKTYDLKP